MADNRTARWPVVAQSVDFDHHAPDMSEIEVWAAYAALHAAGEVAYSQHHGGFWVVSSYERAREVLRDHEGFSSVPSHRLPQRDVPAIIPIDFDPPEHTRYRNAMAEAIRPERLRNLSGFLAEMVTRALDEFRDNGGGEVRRGLSIILPFRVLTGLLGFSEQTAEALLRASDTPSGQPRPGGPSHHSNDAQIRGLIEAEITAHRNAGTASGDYVDWLLTHQVDQGLISPEEAIEILLTFAVSGHRTTMNTVSSIMYLLGTDRALQEELRADPAKAAAYVEETLRLRSPSQNLARRAARTVQVGGTEIPEGDRVVVSLAAANRDEDKFPAGDAFDASRSRRGHLAFGWGIHQCLGAPIARAELKALLEALVRYPRFHVEGEVEFGSVRDGLHFGPTHLTIRFEN